MKLIIDNGDLKILSDDDLLLWEGRPNGVLVLDAKAIPGSSDIIVLGEWHNSPKPYQNVVRCTATGEVKWLVGPLTAVGDCYTSIDVTGDRLFAFTWDCHNNEIDLATGRVLSSIFSK